VRQLEFVKIVLTTVVQVREDGKVVDEMLSNPVSCYSPESMVTIWDNTQAEVNKHNSQQAEEVLPEG
jgi:hypothetical protein